VPRTVPGTAQKEAKMADSKLEMGSSKISSVRGAKREPSWYVPESVLELTIHMLLDPNDYDGRTSNTDLLVALAKIVKTADGKDWMMRPRLIHLDESFYME
jgi:hypothetical protein